MSKKKDKISAAAEDVKEGAIKSVKGMRKLLQEFKDFAMRGNMIDMAVGIVIGTAFTAMVNSLVKDTFIPFITFVIGGGAEDFKGLAWKGIEYGNTITAIINFIILAAVVFVVVKAMNALAGIAQKNKEEEAAAVEATELKVLEEIRDLLKDSEKASKIIK